MAWEVLPQTQLGDELQWPRLGQQRTEATLPLCVISAGLLGGAEEISGGTGAWRLRSLPEVLQLVGGVGISTQV